jgi:hypothetical protein
LTGRPTGGEMGRPVNRDVVGQMTT